MNLPVTSLSGFHRLLFLCENGSEAYLNALGPESMLVLGLSYYVPSLPSPS